MLDFSKYNMISEIEDNELYCYQHFLMDDYLRNKDISSILNISILLTHPLIGDYYESVRILKSAFDESKSIKIAILGAYLMNEWIFDESNYFIGYLAEYINTLKDNKLKSIIFYLIGLDDVKHDYRNKARESFDKSIEFGPEYVCNYLQKASFSNLQERENLLAIAKNNVVKIFTESECSKISLCEYCDFDNYINEYILGITLTEALYNFYFGDSYYEC